MASVHPGLTPLPLSLSGKQEAMESKAHARPEVSVSPYNFYHKHFEGAEANKYNRKKEGLLHQKYEVELRKSSEITTTD